MSHLLDIVRLDTKKGKVPVMLEFPVDPSTAPYLVSSTKTLLWVPEAHPGPVIKAAAREIVLAKEFAAVLDAVYQQGLVWHWDNAHPFTQEGLEAAIAHVRYYDLDDLEILAPNVRGDQHKLGVYERPKWVGEMGLPVRPTSWLPDDTAVVVPKDRQFVGFVGMLTRTEGVVVVHNPSRGIGIARQPGKHMAPQSPENTPKKPVE